MFWYSWKIQKDRKKIAKVCRMRMIFAYPGIVVQADVWSSSCNSFGFLRGRLGGCGDLG